MKKCRFFVYVLTLALIFIGAAGATKASAAQAPVRWNEAENEEYTVVMKQQFTDPDDAASYLNWVEITNGYTVGAGNNVEITVTPAQGYTVTVTAKDGGGGTIELTKSGNAYSFAMGTKSVEITIEANEKQDDGQGGSSQTPESGGGGDTGEGEGTGTSISATAVTYEQEYIEVTSGKQVYFQIVKAADTAEVKAANWIKAAADGGKYYVDFSGTANTKDVFYALTTDPAATKPDKVVTIDAVIKSAKITLNYKTETLKTTEGKGLYEIIGGLTLKTVDKGSDFVWNGKEDLSTLYTLNWKRGANGTWAAAEAFDQLNWDMMKAANSTLYINVSAQKGADGMVDFRPSKETKVKIPKSAKAPTVKVDYVKGTLGLKNGMQVRVNDNTAWLDIVAYDKTETTKDAVFALATANAVTKTKVSNVTVADFVTAIRDENLLNIAVEDGAEITIEARTAATDKKFPSNSGLMKLVLPKAEPAAAQTADITCTAADKANNVEAAFKLDFTQLMQKPSEDSYEEYEYALVGKLADGVNLSKQKWTKLPEDGKVDLAKSIGKDYSWFKKGEDKATKFKYEEMDGILVRKAAVKGTKEVAGAFASAYNDIDVTVTKSATAAPDDPNAEVEWDITEVYLGDVAFYVGENQVEKAKKGTRVRIDVWYLRMPGQYEVDTVKAYLYYNNENSRREVTVETVNGEYFFTMPEGHVTVDVIEKPVGT